MNVKKVIIKLLIFLIVFSSIESIAVKIYAADDEQYQQISNMINLRKSGKYDECIRSADQLLAKDNTLMEAYVNKSMAYFYMNKLEDGLAVLKKQLELNPKNEIALYNAACACALLGKQDQANQYIKQMFALNIGTKKGIKSDKDFNSLKETKEFQRLMGISVLVGGELQDFDVTPITIDGRTMLPMRTIFEALGAKISWDSETNTVRAVKGENTISLTIGKKTAHVNSIEKEMDVAPILLDDRTLVPVRFISEALGAKVNWDSENEVVEILTNPQNGIGNNYEAVKKELDSLSVVSVIDGMWPEPYNLNSKEGMTLIIAKDKKALDLMNSLDASSRAKYMYQTTYENYALVLGCDPVHMKFVYDGKVYYSGEMYYDKKGEGIELTYYEKGLPINIIKQYKKTFNYKDFYLLPVKEQTTSQIGD